MDYHVADARNLSQELVSDGAFDAVIAKAAFEALLDTEDGQGVDEAILEAHRALCSGGTLFIVTSFKDKLEMVLDNMGEGRLWQEIRSTAHIGKGRCKLHFMRLIKWQGPLHLQDQAALSLAPPSHILSELSEWIQDAVSLLESVPNLRLITQQGGLEGVEDALRPEEREDLNDRSAAIGRSADRWVHQQRLDNLGENTIAHSILQSPTIIGASTLVHRSWSRVSGSDVEAPESKRAVGPSQRKRRRSS